MHAILEKATIMMSEDATAGSWIAEFDGNTKKDRHLPATFTAFTHCYAHMHACMHTHSLWNLEGG